MRINLAIIISLLVLSLGFFTDKPYLWIPISVLVAGFIDLFTRQWVRSGRVGRARNLSGIIKLFFALTGFYAMIGQIACIILLIWWFVF